MDRALGRDEPEGVPDPVADQVPGEPRVMEEAQWGGSFRFLMTAMAAALGLLPLAIARGKPERDSGADGRGILCGLLSSTALNMFVVPALYRRFGSVGRRKTVTQAAEEMELV